MTQSTIEDSTHVAINLLEKDPIKVLHVDDELSVLKVAKECLELDGAFQVDSASSVAEAKEKLKAKKFEVIISDYQMPEKDGLEFLKELREGENDVTFIVFTGRGREEVAIQALNLGADRYVNKSGDPETVYGELMHAMGKAVTSKRAEARLRESEKRFRSIVENAGDGIYILDSHGTFLDVNPEAERLTGYRRGDLIGKSLGEIVPPDAFPKGLKSFMDIIREKPIRLELELKTRSNKRVPVELTSTPLVISGRRAGTLGIVRDITERKRTLEEIERSETRFKLLFNRVFDALIIMDKSGRIVDVNEAACKLLNYDKNEFLKLNVMNLHPRGEWPKIESAAKRVLEKGIDYMGETAFKGKDGRNISVEAGGATLKIKDHVYIMGSYRDVSQRKNTEAMYRGMVELSPDGIVALNKRGVITSCNTTASKMLGYSENELVGRHFSRTGVVKARDLKSYAKLFKAVIRGKATKPVELTFRRRDGTPLQCEVRLGVLKEAGKIVGIQAISRDITESKKVERTIRESHEKFERLFRNNPEAADYLDPDFRVLDVNPRFENLFGYSRDDVIGKRINDVLVPPDKMEEAEALDENAEKGYVYYETVRKKKDGSTVPVSISAAPIVINGHLIGTVGLYKDITQLKNTEQTLRDTMEKLELTNEKLRVIGGLTRHDVRNKISAVLGNVYIVKRRLSEKPELLEYLDEIESASQQAITIFDFATAYERLGLEKSSYVKVEGAVADALSLFPNLGNVKAECDCGGLRVLADSLLRQLFYNLIDNSLQHGKSVSQIKISCEELQDQLRLIYEDDGAGIAAKEKTKIFAEGYGKSTGYGLYLIGRMCEVYGWSIRETGKSGRGARFEITVPRIDEYGKEKYLLT